MKQALSLAELSIVLVIIAAIIASISVGSGLFRHMQLVGLVKEVQEMRGAVNQFLLIYKQYPGDVDNAYTVFGSANSCTNVDVNGDAAGCNGDGDGKVEWSAESYRASQHLAQSGLWPNTTNGTSEYFRSSFRNAIYHPMIYCATMTAGFEDMGVNCMQIGSASNRDGAGLKPVEHLHIDSKLDDGLPLTGTIRFRVGGDVTTATCGSTTAYVLTNEEEGCNLLFSVGYD